MNEQSEQSWGDKATFEGTRRENLLLFASTTPDQKLQWLVRMLELIQEGRSQQKHLPPFKSSDG